MVTPRRGRKIHSPKKSWPRLKRGASLALGVTKTFNGGDPKTPQPHPNQNETLVRLQDQRKRGKRTSQGEGEGRGHEEGGRKKQIRGLLGEKERGRTVCVIRRRRSAGGRRTPR